MLDSAVTSLGATLLRVADFASMLASFQVITHSPALMSHRAYALSSATGSVAACAGVAVTASPMSTKTRLAKAARVLRTGPVTPDSRGWVLRAVGSTR